MLFIVVYSWLVVVRYFLGDLISARYMKQLDLPPRRYWNSDLVICDGLMDDGRSWENNNLKRVKDSGCDWD